MPKRQSSETRSNSTKKCKSDAPSPRSVAASIESDIAQSYKRTQLRFARELELATSTTGASSSKLAERDGVQVPSCEKSVGTTIKLKAFEMAERYSELDYSEKCAVIIGINSVLDLSDSTANGQKAIFKDDWSVLHNVFPKACGLRRLKKSTLKKLKTIRCEAEISRGDGYNSARKHELAAGIPLTKAIFAIVAGILNLMNMKSDPLKCAQKMTEYDGIIKLWSFVFESLFSDTDMVLVWGESQLPIPSANDTEPRSPQQRTYFKVDCKMIIRMDGRDHTLAIIEFARHFHFSKIRKDHTKLLIESKAILDSLVHKGCKVTDIIVPSLQICGTSGDFLTLQLARNGLYVANAIDTYHYPTNVKKLEDADKFFSVLTSFRHQTCMLAETLRIALRSSENSFGKEFDRYDSRTQSAPTKEWCRPTWWPSVENLDLPSVDSVFAK